MFRSRKLLDALVAGAIVTIAGIHPATAGHIGSCESSATSAGGVLLTCPAGDGPTLADIGATITVFVRDIVSDPVPNIPAGDFWVQGFAPFNYRLYCTGSGSSNADAPTDMNGYTTISGPVATGGYIAGDVYVIAQGMVIRYYQECNNPIPLVLVSPDIDGNLLVDVVDFGIFGEIFTSGENDPRADYNGDGLVDIVDFGMFGMHYGHTCPIPWD